MSVEETRPKTKDVRAFYDEFLRSQMIKYRVHGNPRLNAATDRVIPLLRPDDCVLDVGCGIGIVAERVAKNVPDGCVLGIDISPQNIWYAKKTTKAQNLFFVEANVVDEPNRVRQMLEMPADAVIMIDVIEHVPAQNRPSLLRDLRKLSSDSSLLILTYPSPKYQRYIKVNKPDELQVVDNIVELGDLIAEASDAGYNLRHYSLEDAWMSNQYCHVIFQTDDSLSRMSAPSKSKNIFGRKMNKLKHKFEERILVPYRRWKYVDSVFGKQQHRD